VLDGSAPRRKQGASKTGTIRASDYTVESRLELFSRLVAEFDASALTTRR
jgi:hypothetical protein